MKSTHHVSIDAEAKLDAYIQRIEAIRWFKPSVELKRSEIDKKVNTVLEAFGVEASIEYRALMTPGDWVAAQDAARVADQDAAWSAARDAAWVAARGTVWDAARAAAWEAARGAAWAASRDAAWAADDVLALNLDLDKYKKKYPNGNFINLIPLWEAGLYPAGVVDGAFIVYVPSL